MSLRVLELFAGIGACSKALERLGIEHEIVDAVEIDKYAVQAFNAVHGTSFEPQDITKWDKDIKCDLIMHGSPCQDFSIAGKQAGGDKDSGTRSSLMYETLRIVEKLRPKYVIWENVRNVVSPKHRHNFDAYQDRMTELGYKNFWKILNAKDYNVPQNRQRVFTVSIREREREYEWPTPMPLERKLSDVLEKSVEEKYYLTDKQIQSFIAQTERAKANGQGFAFVPIEGDSAHTICTRPGSRQTDNFIRERERGVIDGIYNNRPKRVYKTVAPTLTGHAGRLETWEDSMSLPIKTATKKGYDIAKDGDGIDLGYPDSQTRRGRVGHDIAKTLTCSDQMGTLDGMRIRKLTPKECWRLMGFDDEDIEKAQATGLSNAQLYKQAGNSIVVDVLEGILRNLLNGSESRT